MQILPIIEHREGSPITFGEWGTIYKVRDVLRPDGKYGTAVDVREADTYFSLPARMSINGKKVRGFLMVQEFGKHVMPEGYNWGDAENRNNGWELQVWTFTPYTYQSEGK